jgi:hypothetical protein
VTPSRSCSCFELCGKYWCPQARTYYTSWVALSWLTPQVLSKVESKSKAGRAVRPIALEPIEFIIRACWAQVYILGVNAINNKLLQLNLTSTVACPTSAVHLVWWARTSTLGQMRVVLACDSLVNVVSIPVPVRSQGTRHAWMARGST